MVMFALYNSKRLKHPKHANQEGSLDSETTQWKTVASMGAITFKQNLPFKQTKHAKLRGAI
jgi:hypothetical protein